MKGAVFGCKINVFAKVLQQNEALIKVVVDEKEEERREENEKMRYSKTWIIDD